MSTKLWGITGNIGVGKTTFMKAMCEKWPEYPDGNGYQCQALPEPLAEIHNFQQYLQALEQFEQNLRKTPYQAHLVLEVQIKFQEATGVLLEKAVQQMQTGSSGMMFILDQTPQMHSAYVRRFVEKGLIDQVGAQQYEEVFHRVEGIAPLDLLLHLDTSIPVTMERIRERAENDPSRAREIEAYSKEYLTELHAQQARIFDEHQGAKLLIKYDQPDIRLGDPELFQVFDRISDKLNRL